MSGLRPFVYEALPAELRLYIYRLLLVNHGANEEFDRLHSDTGVDRLTTELHNDEFSDSDDEEDDNYVDLDGFMDDDEEDDFEEMESDEDSEIMVEDCLNVDHRPQTTDEFQDQYARKPLWKVSALYPTILRTGKLIHEEAAQVLYGENIFDWYVTGATSRGMWHTAGSSAPRLAQHYSCLITRLHLTIHFGGPSNIDNDTFKENMSTTRSLGKICAELASRNPLRMLKVDYLRLSRENLLKVSLGTLDASGFIEDTQESCLEPLKDVRAIKVS